MFLPILYSQAYQIQKGAPAGKKVRKIVNIYRDLRADQNVILLPGCFLMAATATATNRRYNLNLRLNFLTFDYRWQARKRICNSRRCLAKTENGHI